MESLFLYLSDPMRILYIVGGCMVLYLIFNQLQGRSKSKNLRDKMGSAAKYRDNMASETRRAANSGSLFENSEILNKITERFDLSQDSFFIDIKKLRLLSARAGITAPDKLKKILFAIYALPFVFGPGAWFLAKFYLGFEIDFMKSIAVIVGGGAFGYFFPIMRLKSMAEARRKELNQYFPDMLDLLQVCVESGMSIEQSFIRITDEIAESSPVTAEQLAITGAELSHFLDQKIAYNNLALRTGLPQYKSLVSVLIQSSLYGTPLVQGLRALSSEQRDIQMSEVERRAAALPAKLTVPLMLFIMPVLFVVIMAPAVIDLGTIM